MCSLCRLPVAKNYNFGQILKFWGLPYRRPYTDEDQIWCAIADTRSTLRLRAKFRIDRFIVSLCGGETPQLFPIFAIFWTSAYSVVAIWQQSDKVEHGCTTTNLPLPNGIKIVSVLQRLHGEIGRTNSDAQKRDEQTDKQTDRQKKLNVFGHPGGG